ncbi:helix-turn-helix transcriptional regulator [Paraburkholderia acidiphila]|uniref:HTH luxR-type domain-containing protein n=1 Tax=Paraburkholderia acidiphila TaxID=2571747 RepID=A0A7Z2J9Z8_9BURK|nr:helix-turn-helix transcriptional regulator [Paraburkholderia acidiphila]QGZ56901.1 hypothetical protein FAZ97_18280 [Paraburkholderia acidiphila]
MELQSGRLAELVASIGTGRIGRSVLNLFEPMDGIVHAFAFERIERAPPGVLFAAARDPDEDAGTDGLVRDWTAADYQVDPVLQALDADTSRHESASFRDARQYAGSAARDRFIERYYGGHELGEEVNFSVREGNRLLVLSLCRRRRDGQFSGDERGALAGIAPLMLACARQCLQHRMRPLAARERSPAVSDWRARRGERLNRLRSAMKAAPGRLTEREAEICAHIVMGFSAEAIGLQLVISPQTVASHRKHAYAKLGVSSQSELFALWHLFAERSV